MPQTIATESSLHTPRQEIEQQLMGDDPSRNSLAELHSRYNERWRRVIEQLGPARTHRSNNKSITACEHAMMCLHYELRQPTINVDRYKSELITLVTHLRKLESTALAMVTQHD